MEALFSPEVYARILPVIIFIARAIDVSMGTVRIMMIAKNRKELAMLIGFFEITIWLLIAAKAIAHVDNLLYIVAYAGGFATGNYIGVLIEEKLALGKISVRLIVQSEPSRFIEALKNDGFGVTYYEAKGTQGKAWVIYSVMHRRKFNQFDSLAKQHHPQAFISAEDARLVKEGVFHPIESPVLAGRGPSSKKVK
jgi:uncharacterized protein YebE (UPF0316 family)